MILTIKSTVDRGKYQIEQFLGAGGFGEVYLAQDNQLDRLVAIKVIHRGPGSTSDEYRDYEDRFRQEAQIGARVRDDNVIAVYALQQDEENLLLVTEYASGGSLATKIFNAPLSPEQAIDVGVQICKGVAAIQRPPLSGVHRDIKPSNILFDDLGRAKVADLGLVQVYGMSGRSIDMAGKHPGTPGYMSPEQERETSYLKPASDVFSIGCVLFEALTQKMYQSLPSGTKLSSLNEQVSPELEAVIERALAVEVDKRYENAEAMMNALQAVKMKPSKPPGPVQPPPPPVDPTLLSFRSGQKARTTEELVALADANWPESVSLLASGALERWLVAIQRPELSVQVAEMRQKQPDAEIALEQVLHLFDPELAQPQLALDLTALEFGQVPHGERRTLRLNLANRGRGLLYGSLKTPVPWLRLSRDAVRCRGGQTQVVEVWLDASRLVDGEFCPPAAIQVETNGGQTQVSAHVVITWQPALAVPQASLNFGEYKIGVDDEIRQQTLTVRNRGGGRLLGSVSTPAEWLAISPSSFELGSEREVEIQVSADPNQLYNMDIYNAEISVATNAGTQLIPARITAIMEGLQSAQRWQNWGVYLGAMLFVLAAWAVPLAYARAWLFGQLPTPEIWQMVLLGVFPLLAWAVAIFIPRRLVSALDQAENFYHRRDLAAEIPGRTGNFLKRLVFSLLAGGAAAFLAYGLQNTLQGLRFLMQPDQTILKKIPIHILADTYELTFTWFALAAFLCTFLFAFLLFTGYPAGGRLGRGQRLLAGPRSISLAVLAMLVMYTLRPAESRWWMYAWPALLGILLGAETLASFPLRLKWLYARFMPVVPLVLLLWLDFEWAKTGLLKPTVPSLTGYYTTYRQIPLQAIVFWPSLGYVLIVLVLGLLGVWLDSSRDSDFRSRLSAAFAALFFGGLLSLLSYYLFGFFLWLLGADTVLKMTGFTGALGIALAIFFAGAILWALSDRRRWFKHGLDWISRQAGRIFARVPALARRAGQAVKDTSQRVGIDQGQLRSVDLETTGKKAGELLRRTRLHTGLGDYLSGDAIIPATASLTAIAIILFSLPSFYGLVAQSLSWLAQVGQIMLVLLLCFGVAAGMILAGYLLWKRSQVKVIK